MAKVKLAKYLKEYSVKNKQNAAYPVYSVTNKVGFCTEYFNKDVSSKDKTTYKIVPYGCFAYNPSRINVGSIDWQRYESNVIVSPLYNVFECNKDLDQRYLKYFIKSPYGKFLINEKVSGSVRFNLKFQTLCDFEIEERTMEEQIEIVDLLDKINTQIILAEKEIELYNELISSKFEELFAEKFKRGTTELGKLMIPTIGLTYKPENITEEGTIVLRSGNVQQGELYLEEDVVKVSNIKIPDNKIIMENDILMCSRNGSSKLVGKCCLITKPESKMTFGAFMTVIRTEYPYFLTGFFNSSYFKNQLTTIGTSSINQLTSDTLKSIRVAEPDKEEEKLFKSFVVEIEKNKINAKRRIKLYNEMLNNKLNEYFN